MKKLNENNNPYPGLDIPVEESLTNETTDIEVKIDPNTQQPIENPVYPDDYEFLDYITIKDGSDNYTLAGIENNVYTTDHFNAVYGEAELKTGTTNILGVALTAPEPSTQYPNMPKLYANKLFAEIDISQWQQTKIKINRFYISTTYKTIGLNFSTYTSSISNFTVNSGEAVVRIVESTSIYTINLLVNNDVNNKSITLPYDSGKTNKYCKWAQTNGSSVLKLCYNNSTSIVEFVDESLDVNFSYITLNKNKFEIQ